MDDDMLFEACELAAKDLKVAGFAGSGDAGHFLVRVIIALHKRVIALENQLKTPDP